MSAAVQPPDYWSLPMSERERLRNAGLTPEQREARDQAWRTENADAFAALNEHYEKYGLSFPSLRPSIEAMPDDWDGEI